MKLRSKMILLNSAAVFFIMLVFFYLTISYTNSKVPETVEGFADQVLQARTDELSNWFSKYKSNLVGLASMEAWLDETQVEDLFRQAIKNKDPGLEGYAYVRKSGDFTDSTGGSSNVSNRPYFKNIMSGKTDFEMTSALIARSTKTPIIVLAHAVKDSQGTTQGVLLATIRLTYLAKWAKEVEFFGGYLGVMDADTKLIAHRSPKLVGIKVSESDEKLGTKGLSGTFAGDKSHRVYKSVDGKLYVGSNKKIPGTPLYIASSISYDLMHEASNSITKRSILLLVITILILPFLIGFITTRITAPLEKVIKKLQSFKGKADLTVHLPVTTKDEYGDLSAAFNDFVENIKNIMQELMQTSYSVRENATYVNEESTKIASDLDKQKASVNMIATSMTQMVNTLQEVTNYAKSASVASSSGVNDSTEAQNIIRSSVAAITSQAQKLLTASHDINQLQETGNKIGEVMEVINAIAEQTNLLALNAAIEAARAGEAGRGFAVVADEVRSLAARTHESTTEIKNTVEDLQGKITEAVSSIKENSDAAQLNVEQIQKAGDAVLGINSAIEEIESMNSQIANATETQTSMAKELDQNLDSIVNLGALVTNSADNLLNMSQELESASLKLNEILDKFVVR